MKEKFNFCLKLNLKSNDKLEMKFHLKAKYHIHFNLHVVKWSDKDGPPYRRAQLNAVNELQVKNL